MANLTVTWTTDRPATSWVEYGPATASGTSGMLWGLQTTYPHGFSTDYATILSNLGTAKPSIIHLGTLQMSSGNTFSTSGLSTTAASATAQGGYPAMDLYTTTSTDTTNPTGLAYTWRNASITAGTHDTYLHSLWASFASYGKPILVFYNCEMNGTWYPAYSDINAINGAGSFKSAWQYVHDQSVADGATNITWVLIYNIQAADGSGASTAETTQPMTQFWPGRSYVDLVGLDGMNFSGGGSGTGGPASGNNWYTIDQVMDGATGSAYGKSWTHMTALDSTVPCSFASFSCDSRRGKDQNASWATAPVVDGANKGAWYDDLAVKLASKYSRIALWRYYNVDHTGVNAEPYANGWSQRDNDSAFMTPYTTATGATYTSPDTGNVLTATVVSPGAQQTNFKNLVSGSNHIQGGSFTLATSGKVPLTSTTATYPLSSGLIDTALVTSHSVTLTGLSPGTYNYRIHSRNAGGTESVTSNAQFTISGAGGGTTAQSFLVMVAS